MPCNIPIPNLMHISSMDPSILASRASQYQKGKTNKPIRILGHNNNVASSPIKFSANPSSNMQNHKTFYYLI